MATLTKFKSSICEKRWIDLQKEKVELQGKKTTDAIKEKLEIISSLMTSCKVGFNLSEAKVKKITRFLKEKTGKDNVKYGYLPEGIKPESTLFKDIVVLFVESNGQIVFKENES